MSRKTSKNLDYSAPKSRIFSDLIGFNETKESFIQLLNADRLPQVILFEGRAGIGKKKLLAQLSAAIYCATRNACGSCDGCQSVIRSYQADLLWIEAEGSIKVADADLLQEHLSYRASGGVSQGQAQRVVVLVDLEQMNDQAANRLLKVLEEPPPQSLILMSTSCPQRLLATISSRVVRWQVKPPPVEESLAWLMRQWTDASTAPSADLIQDYLQRYSLAPGRTLLALQQLNTADLEDLKRLGSLLLRPLDGQDLPELSDLVKRSGLRANELAEQVELSLNRYYKLKLGVAPATAQDPLAKLPAANAAEIRQRRRVLQQIYRGGRQGQNYLNVQMAAEALGTEAVL